MVVNKMAKEKQPEPNKELLERMSNVLPGATAEIRKQMADPNLMTSRVYVAPKNTVNKKGTDLPPGVPGA